MPMMMIDDIMYIKTHSLGTLGDVRARIVPPEKGGYLKSEPQVGW